MVDSGFGAFVIFLLIMGFLIFMMFFPNYCDGKKWEEERKKEAEEKEKIKNEAEIILEKYRYLENENIIWIYYSYSPYRRIIVFYRKDGKNYQVNIACSYETKDYIFEYFDKLVNKYYQTVENKKKYKLTFEERFFSDRKLVNDYCSYITDGRSLKDKLSHFSSIIHDNYYDNNQTEKMFIDMVSKADSNIADIFTRIKDDYNNYMNQK